MKYTAIIIFVTLFASIGLSQQPERKLKKAEPEKSDQSINDGDQIFIIGNDESVIAVKRDEDGKFPAEVIATVNKKNTVIRVSSAYMGVRISSSDTGLKIIDLIEDGPADKGELHVGDIIQKVNGARITTVDNLTTLISMFEPNDKINIEFTRSGRAKNLNLTLEVR